MNKNRLGYCCILVAALIAVSSCGGGGSNSTPPATPLPNVQVTDSIAPDSDHEVPFGTVTQTNTLDQVVTVTNSGTTNLVIGTVASANPLAAPFSIVEDSCSGQTIAPAGACTVAIRFAPLTVNSFNDEFDIPSNDSDTTTITIRVSGMGTSSPIPNISIVDSVAPNSDLQIPFGSMPQGSASDQTVTVANIGTADLVIGNVATVNPVGAPFRMTSDTCSGQSISPAGSCSLTIRFEPAAVRSFSNSFDIPSNDPDTPTIIFNLSGSGTAVPVPNISVIDSVNPHDDLDVPFGNVMQGTPSDQILAVTNNGTANLVIGNVASANSLSVPFSITADTCSGKTITPAGSCSLTIRFTPIGVGSFSDSFDIPSNDPDKSSLNITISGTGITGFYQMGGAIQGTPLSLTNTVSTLAGVSVLGFRDGTGTAARFKLPRGMTSDGTNLYVVDTGNQTIRKIVISTGSVTTIAGRPGVLGFSDGLGSAATFWNPNGITTDGTDLYVADTSNNRIRKINISSGAVTTIAGSASSGSVDGTGPAARFKNPEGIATDGMNLYISDTGNHTIRMIVISTGVVTTIAGLSGTTGATDGTGSAATFWNPSGIISEGTNLYVTDYNNCTIRHIDISSGSTGVVTTFAGNGGACSYTDGTGSAARFKYPRGITSDGTNLYVADTSNYRIRMINISTGAVTTIAGWTGLETPFGITADGTNLYVTDMDNHNIRKMVLSTRVVSTFAGTTSPEGGSADGTGTAATFDVPVGITTEGANLYVADDMNNTIRKIVMSSGEVSTIAGKARVSGSQDGTGGSARFFGPTGITTDGTNLYVTDSGMHTIRKIVIASGEVTTFAGWPGASGSTDGTGNAARFFSPSGITTDGTNLYVADNLNHTIRKIVISSGDVTTLAGMAGSSGPADGTGAAARFKYPNGITTDGISLYVCDSLNSTIRKIDIANCAVTTLAGKAGSNGFANGTGSAATFWYPYGITTDGTNLYVVERSNDMVRKIVISTRVVTTIAGSTQSGSADGAGSAARFDSPLGITSDGLSLYVTDTQNNTIRRIQ